MKIRLLYISFLLIAGKFAYSQEATPLGRTAFSFNLTRMAVNEVNMSIERFISSRKSLEFSGGLVYVNEFLEGQVNDWYNAEDMFLEHGYAARIHYKVFKRVEVETKWRDYAAFGIAYKSVYYNDRPFVTELKPDHVVDTIFFTESYLRKRERKVFGVEFLWGKVYEASRVFAFEFYLGARIDGTMATRTDHDRFAKYKSSVNQWRNTTIPDFVEKSFYVRPSIQLGMKLRIRV